MKTVCVDNTNKTKLLVAGSAGLLGAIGGYLLFLRPWHLKWGTQVDEAEAILPGDSWIPDAESVATHGISIDAPPSAVWPWLAQMGQEEGGFYSYEALENLVGCDMHNAYELHPEWQAVKTGDAIVLHPEAPPMKVLDVEMDRHLVLGTDLEEPNATTWAFVLRPDGDGTRLLVRLRGRTARVIDKAVSFAVEPAHFIMERKMMLTLKKLAEDRAAELQPA
jgi:hypothetical protein